MWYNILSGPLTGSYKKAAFIVLEDACDLGQDLVPCTVTLEGYEAVKGRLRD